MTKVAKKRGFWMRTVQIHAGNTKLIHNIFKNVDIPLFLMDLQMDLVGRRMNVKHRLGVVRACFEGENAFVIVLLILPFF